MQNKKYYICVTPFFPSPDNWRGAYVLDQVKAIQCNSDYEVMVFRATSHKDNMREYEVDGVKVYLYHTCDFPSNILNGFFNGCNARSFVRRVKKVGIDPQKVAFVHCHVSMHAACGLALKKLNPNIKILLQHHDLDPFNLRSGVIGRYNRWNQRYRAKKAIVLYNQVDLHVCISEACRDSLQSFPNARKGEVYEDYRRVLKLNEGLPSIKPRATYVLYNGVDTSLFKPALSSNSSILSSIFRIGCIANFQELKGHITLIKAFEMLINKGYTNLRLSLLGKGETIDYCERYLEEHNLMQYVEWPKEVPHDKLPEYYQSLNLFVLPSYFEGFGCVYTESAACGVPYMGCVEQGYSEYIKEADRDKWLVTPNDMNKLAANIEFYINNLPRQDYAYPLNIDVLINDFLLYLKTI